MDQNTSVYDLMTKLCRQLTLETGKFNEKCVKHYRTLAFEMLLKRSYEAFPNPLKEFNYYIFERQVDACTPSEYEKCDELIRIYDKYEDLESPHNEVLSFLLQLRDSIPDTQKQNNFFPLNLTISYKDNPYMLQSSKTDFFKLAEFSEVKPIQPEPCEKFFVLRDELGIECVDDIEDIDKIVESEGSEKSFRNDTEYHVNIDGFNWENLGLTHIRLEQSFASEINSIHHLQVHATDQNSETKLVTLNDLLRDLKSLAIGVESDLFIYNTNTFSFSAVPGITLDTLTSETLAKFIEPIIECGTCFKRVQLLTKPNFNSYLNMQIKGFVFNALCSTVDKYLAIFRKYVWSYHDSTICQFLMRIQKLMNQIISLSKIFGVHPLSDGMHILPIGSDFLTFLYENIIQVTQKNVSMLYMCLLRNCCDVYFKYFEKWIFCGILEDPENELFIEHVDKYKPNTKQYFDKAFLVVKRSVPGFLNGYEDEILLCGKYTMLLQAYKPDHLLFGLKTPKLRVCVSSAAIEELEQECSEFLQKALDVCGPATSFQDIFQKRIDERMEFQQKLQHKFQENLKNWRMEQDQKLIIESELKQKRLEELQQQINEIKEQKLADKLAEIELDKYYTQQAVEKEEIEIAKEAEVIKKRVEYYEELNRLADERKNEAEKEVERLKNEIMSMSTTSDNFTTPDDGVFQLKIELFDNTSESAPSPTIESDDTNMNIIPIPKMKHSVSDHFNANFDKSNQETTDISHNKNLNTEDIIVSSCASTNGKSTLFSEFNRNKKRILGSDQIMWGNDDGDECHRSPVDDNLNPLSEFQQNRNKAYSSQGYGMEIDLVMVKEVKDAKKILEVSKETVYCANSPGPLSDRDRNRLKVMSSEINMKPEEISDIPKIIVPAEMTDLQRNRLRVMSEEYNRSPSPPRFPRANLNLDLDRVKNKQKVLESEYNIITGSPMSTDSDITPFRENDMLDVADHKDVYKFKKFGIPDTALLNEPTPDSALNTAGLIAKDGFKFPVPNNVDDSNSVSPNIATKKTNLFLTMMMMDTDEDDIKKSSTKGISLSEFSDIKMITFTKRLQASIVIPLSTQLQILNNEIFKIFLCDLKIINHFRSLRHFYFLMDGEFGSSICDGLISRLEQGSNPKELFYFNTLSMILENALGTSALCDDSNADRLSFNVNSIPDKFDLTAPDAFGDLSLCYQVKWPLNLIINSEVLDHYATIFRYLIKVRRMSWILEESMNHLKSLVKTQGRQLGMAPQYLYIQQFRHKLTHFIMTLQNYITSNALQATWKQFKDQLLTTTTIEGLYHSHITYIKQILFLCMLNRQSGKYYKAIEGIFKITIKFYRRLISGKWRKVSGNLNFTHSKYDKLLKDAEEFDASVKYIVHLGQKCASSGYQSEIFQFITLINLNGYYNRN